MGGGNIVLLEVDCWQPLSHMSAANHDMFVYCRV